LDLFRGPTVLKMDALTSQDLARVLNAKKRQRNFAEYLVQDEEVRADARGRGDGSKANPRDAV